MLLTELTEESVTGENAAIYADIRRLGGVPMVALIFRHLATLPGALEWLWAGVGPAWRSGRLQEAAWRVAGEARLEPIAAMPRAALAAMGVDAAAEREIRDVLVAYNRANPENLLTMLCAMGLLHGRVAQAPLAPRDWSPPPAPGPLAPMAAPATYSAEISELLELVAAPGEPGGARVVQSLYRHFVHRPAFLAQAIRRLRARFDDGSVERSAATIHAAMSSEADDIVRALAAPPAPHLGISPVCARFSGRVIPQMIVVGRLLDHALPK